MFFLNSANFASNALLTLAPPSSYALNLKALIKVSKVSLRSQLLQEILRFSLERKFDKTNLISPKRTPLKSPGLLGLGSVIFFQESNKNVNPLETHNFYVNLKHFPALAIARGQLLQSCMHFSKTALCLKCFDVTLCALM